MGRWWKKVVERQREVDELERKIGLLEKQLNAYRIDLGKIPELDKCYRITWLSMIDKLEEYNLSVYEWRKKRNILYRLFGIE